MKCFHCKRELQAGDRFCPYCGEDQGFDQSLIDAARAGDQDAVADLYSRTYENVYHTVRALIRDEDTVLDLVQDSFVKAFANLDKLSDPNKFRAWVKRIGHNLAVDCTRRAKPLLFSQMTEEESERVLSFEDQRPENSPELVLDRQETSRLVREILDCLSEDQRLVVGMYYYEQRSVREIARELGVSENTVKSRLYQGRSKIETRVRSLEARGTKLYSLSPVAFLLALLRRAESFPPQIPAEQILERVSERLPGASLGQGLARSGAEETARAAGAWAARSSARKAAGTAARAARASGHAAAGAAKAAGAGLAKGAAVKVAALITAAAVAIGGGAYAVHEIRQGREESPAPVENLRPAWFQSGESLPLTDRETEPPKPETAGSPAEDPVASAPTESPAPPAESAAPAESARPEEDRLALNQFLSTFAEWPTFSHFSYSAYDGDGEWTEIRSRLVDYAFWYTRFHHNASVHPEGEYYSIRLETVNEVLDRVFGFTLSEAEAEDFTGTNRSRAHYSNGSFYFPAADGECYNRLNLVREIEARGTDTYALSFDLFTLNAERYMEQGVIPEAYYGLTTEEALGEPDLSRELSGEAVVHTFERDGQTVYRLLAYRIGGEPEPLQEPLTEPLTLDRMAWRADGDMQLEYPVFRGQRSAEVNAFVSDFVSGILTSLDDRYSEGYRGSYRCAVTLLNEQVLSMVFWGEVASEGGITGHQGLRTLNLDLETLQPFVLADRYRADTPGFLDAVYAEGRWPGEPVTCFADWEYGFYWSDHRESRDLGDSVRYAQCFYTESGLVLSFYSEMFSGCDHFEVMLPYDALAAFAVGSDGPAAPADPAEEPLTLDRFETLREGEMAVEYPIFRGKGAWEVSQTVYERALELVTIQYDDIPQEALSGEYSCAVTLLNDRVLSLVFYGWSYIEGGAHPWADLIPMNLDLQTLESFKLSELYRMGTPDFVELCYAKGRFPGEPVTAFSEDYYSEAFAYERDTGHNMQYANDGFLKPEGAVFSCPSDHFIGDHLETLVLYEDLRDFYIGPYSPEELSAHRPEKNGLDPALCQAYLRQLASREEDIRYFAQKNGSGVRNVAISDLSGDGVPELLYVTSQQGAGGSFLWIYRYENGQAVKAGQFTWEPEAGQEILRCVFRRENDPCLYLLYAGGFGNAWTTSVQRLSPQADGSFSAQSFARESRYESGHNPDYFFDGRAYDLDEYCGLLAAFYEGVDQVLLYDLRDGEDGRFLSTVDDAVLLLPDCYAMHYDRAVAWLKAR